MGGRMKKTVVSQTSWDFFYNDRKVNQYQSMKEVRRWKISRRNMTSLGILCMEGLLLICFMLIAKPGSLDETIRTVGAAAFVCMLFSCLAVYYINKILDFSIVYTILAYLFSFGQSILAAFGYTLNANSVFSINNGYFSSEEILGSSCFALTAICFTCIGICLSDRKKYKKTDYKPYYKNEDRIRRLGWILLLIGIIPTLFCTYLDIKTTFTVSYGATIQDYRGLAKIFSLISGFFISGILILLCFERSKNKRIFLWIILSGYIALQLATGSRLTIIRLGIVIWLLWNQLFKDISRKKFFFIVIACFIGLFILSLVSSVRIHLSGSSDLLGLLAKSSVDLVKKNYFLKVIAEMGNTQMVNLLVYKHCPTDSPFQLGFSYLKIFWAIIPNVLRVKNTNYIGVDITFSDLYKRTSAPMGASFVAEGYWNFGWASLVLFVLFGVFLGKIADKYHSLCNSDGTKSAMELFIIVYLIYYMIFMTRGELLGFGRSFVYYAVIPLVLSWLRFPKNKRMVSRIKKMVPLYVSQRSEDGYSDK